MLLIGKKSMAYCTGKLIKNHTFSWNSQLLLSFITILLTIDRISIEKVVNRVLSGDIPRGFITPGSPWKMRSIA